MCHISIIWDIEVMKLLKLSVRHMGDTSSNVLRVVPATKMEQKEFI